MLRHLIVTSLFLAAMAPATARAQSQDEQYWLAYVFTGRVTDGGAGPRADRGLSLGYETQGRRSFDRTVYLVRPSVGYRLGPSLSLWGGYALVPAVLDTRPDTYEHRGWQQAIAQASAGVFSFQFRPRFEQRVRRDVDGVNHRARFFGAARVRFSQENPLGFVLWDEVFVRANETSWAGPSGFDQNRLFVGPTWTSGPFRFEAGYLNLNLKRNGERVTNHIGALYVYHAI